MSDFDLYPAVDIRGGGVVRLRRGDFDAETSYESDPLELAESYAAEGARWLHLVDLDGALAGGYALAPLLGAVKARTRLRVQTGGGVRSGADVARLFDLGADRVVVGSLAVREPERVAAWVARFGPDRVVVALDARRDEAGTWRLPVRGWTEPTGRSLGDLAAFFAAAGLRHLLCTDIDRDGMLSGPSLELYAGLTAAVPGVAVQASGGVRSAGDVAAARSAGCRGVVLGRALLEGRLALAGLVPRAARAKAGPEGASC